MAQAPAELLQRTQGVARASDLVGEANTHLPVVEALRGLLPEEALRRGTVTSVDGNGATSLALALASQASQDGGWTAVVGVPDLCALAARELGVSLDRLAIVPRPGEAWGQVIAALVDAFDVVIAGGRAKESSARKITARVRERGAVLVAVGSWPSGVEVDLFTTNARWDGSDNGYGHLRSRAIRVEARSRRSGTPRKSRLWLPAPDGGITLAVEAARARRTG